MTGVFLQDVVFLIDRSNCVALSTVKVSEQIVNEAGKITSFSTTTGNKHSPINFYTADLSKVSQTFIADTRCRTFTFHTFAHIV